MSHETFFAYLTKEDIQSSLSTTVRNKTEEALHKLFFKELKENKISQTKARNLWIKAMKNLFANEFQRFYHFTPSTKYGTSTKLKNDLHKNAKILAQEQDLELSKASLVKINSSPLHYLYAVNLTKDADFLSILKSPIDSLMILSVLPTMGVAVYWPIAKNKKIKLIPKILKSIFNNVVEIKVNALLLRKYAIQENITKLGISTPQEIAGFAGLDVIEFHGSNVMLGLSGLKRRHDANVDVITRVGPFTEIESDVIRLMCGKGIQTKTYEGLEALLRTVKAG